MGLDLLSSAFELTPGIHTCCQALPGEYSRGQFKSTTKHSLNQLCAFELSPGIHTHAPPSEYCRVSSKAPPNTFCTHCYKTRPSQSEHLLMLGGAGTIMIMCRSQPCWSYWVGCVCVKDTRHRSQHINHQFDRACNWVRWRWNDMPTLM
jgi:hypothetical protein